MSRSLALTMGTVALFASLCGCRAQEASRSLDATLQRLESRVERMDAYVQSLEEGRAEENAEQKRQIAERDHELRRLRDLAHEQERALAVAREEREKLARRAEELEAHAHELEIEREREHVEFEQRLAAEHEELEGALREKGKALERIESRLRENEKKRVAQEKALRDREKALREMSRKLERAEAARKAQERRSRKEADRLEALVEAKHREFEGALRKARSEAAERKRVIAELRQKLAAREASRGTRKALVAPPAPPASGAQSPPRGAIIIHNAEGEVHLHFHGDGPRPPIAPPAPPPPPTAHCAAPHREGKAKPEAGKAQGSGRPPRHRRSPHADRKRINDDVEAEFDELFEELFGR